jgi:16S rRNA (adenine1518-N6/adenine1519-N6)-dimethyltransferase
VLEVGPGIGTLTCALLRRAYVVAVECDADLPPVLAETCALDGERLRIVQADALKIDRRQIEQACAELGAPLPSRLVANLPYQVAATLVLDWFERFDFIESMTVMVQAEVADRMAAAPGTKDYGAYTVKLALRAHVAGRFSVPPTCFAPRPHVDSAVAQRRKTIRNSMKSRLDAATADAALAACGIDPTTRAETLSPGAYLRMASALLSRA